MTELYLRKSQPVEAVQFTGGEMQAAEIDAWMDLWGNVRYIRERFVDSKEPQFIDGETLIPVLQFPEHLTITTDIEQYHIPLNYWMVKDHTGVLLVMNEASFTNTYERYEL